MSTWVEHAPLPLGVVRDGRIVHANVAFARLIGRPPSDIVGASIDDVIAPADRGTLASSNGREIGIVCSGGEVRTVEVFVAHHGDDIIFQLCDRSERAHRLERMARVLRIGVEVQAGHPSESLFSHVAVGLANMGITCARFVPCDGRMRVADIRVPEATGPDIESSAATRLDDIVCAWAHAFDVALGSGVAYIDDTSAFAMELLGRDVSKDARARATPWKLERGVLVRVSPTTEAAHVWMLSAPWITPEDLPAFALFGSQISAALDVARVIGDLFERNASLAAINRLAEVASTASGPDDLFESFAKSLHGAIACDSVALFLLDERGEELVLAHQHGLPLRDDTPRRYPVIGTRMGEVVRSGVPNICGPADLNAFGRDIAEQYGIKVIVNVPLVARSRTIGLLNVSRRENRPMSASDLELMHAAGAHLASAVEAHRLFVDLRKSYADLARTQEQLVQRERLAAIGELAAVVAHEVRNPLGVIFNSIGTIRRLLGDDERAWTLVRILEEEATRLNHIVGDLLDFARPRIPALQRDRIETVLDDAVAAAVASAADVTVVREIDPNLPAVPMDARLMRQALLNIAQNAVQAMPEGGTLTVRAKKNGSAVRVSIEDTGPGIPPDIRARIFEPFFTTRARGTGLGLAVVKRIVDGHAGEIELATEVGRGTTFCVSLPLSDP